jgi:glucoamylase
MLTEIFYPCVDLAQIKELNFIIGDGQGFWTDLRGIADYEVEEPAPGVPALTIRHRHDRFCLISKICADPLRDVVLVDLQLQGEESLRPYALLSPRLGESAENHMARQLRATGFAALIAAQGGFELAMMAADAEGDDAVGAVNFGEIGQSDTWQDFARHGRMTWRKPKAGPGRLCLATALPKRATVAVGLGSTATAATTLARASLASPFATSWDRYCQLWQDYLARIAAVDAVEEELRPMLARSIMILKVSADHAFPGGRVASLSSPWGNRMHNRGGYHLVWPRDLVEAAGGLIALGLASEAREVLQYLIATQRPDGHWYQNQWITGASHWRGMQLDEAAFPVLLAGLLADRQMLDGVRVREMVRKALSFIARQGPLTEEDRWENKGGVSAFTLAVAISALIEGAQFLDEPACTFARELADEWNASIEEWTFQSGGTLAEQLGIPGYYVRLAPAEVAEGEHGLAAQPNEHRLGGAQSASEQLGIDFLQLVRYGLRRPDEPRVKATIKAVDALLKRETPSGPVWHRYTKDAYGEHADGSAFDGSGQGRGWPLLTGERGHYGLVAGEDPLPYLRAMVLMSGKGGLLPEQVWDNDPIPEHKLYPGKPTGSAMPLVWAHAEFIKLALSKSRREPVDRPPRVRDRYHGNIPRRRWVAWSFRLKRRSIPRGFPLRQHGPILGKVDATSSC